MNKDATYYQIQAYRMASAFKKLKGLNPEQAASFEVAATVLKGMAEFIQSQAELIHELQNDQS